jgi:hypothetical protein
MKKNVLMLNLAVALILSACGSGGSGSSTPSGPEYLPVGKYLVSSKVEPSSGNQFPEACNTLSIATFTLFLTTANIGESGEVSIPNFIGGNLNFQMNLHNNPIASFPSNLPGLSNDTIQSYLGMTKSGGYEFISTYSVIQPVYSIAKCAIHTVFESQA